VRSQANFQNLNLGATFATTDAFGAGKALENEPVCPAVGTYPWIGAIPNVGAAYGACNFTDPDAVTTHVLAAIDTKDW
jgi:hypothetical protein